MVALARDLGVEAVNLDLGCRAAARSPTTPRSRSLLPSCAKPTSGWPRWATTAGPGSLGGAGRDARGLAAVAAARPTEGPGADEQLRRGVRAISIRPDGCVVPCDRMWDYVVGDLRHESLGQVWRESPALAALRRRFETPVGVADGCGECEHRAACHGGRPAVPYCAGRGLYDYDPLSCVKVLRVPGRATSSVTPATVDVVIGGLRVRIESRHPALPLARLAATFRGFVDEVRGRPHAWLRVEAVTCGARPAPLLRRVAALLHTIGGRPRLAHGRPRPAAARARGRAPPRPGRADPRGRHAGRRDRARDLRLASWGLRRRRRCPRRAAPRPPARTRFDLARARQRPRRAPLAGGRGPRRLLLHGAAIADRERAVVFVGRSGAGKSTVSRRLPAAALGDDGVLVLPRRGGFAVYGTPLTQLPRRRDRQALATRGLPLRALLLLRQSRRDRLSAVRAARRSPRRSGTTCTSRRCAAGARGPGARRTGPGCTRACRRGGSELTRAVDVGQLLARFGDPRATGTRRRVERRTSNVER
ncbi:MAG: SPASM domain-containing protein [Rhodopseudomonas palustris]|nr:SPASM domain-containing protein [Rhodopseudomonas palustris]